LFLRFYLKNYLGKDISKICELIQKLKRRITFIRFTSLTMKAKIGLFRKR